MNTVAHTIKQLRNNIINTLMMRGASDSPHLLYRANMLRFIIYGNLVGILIFIVFTVSSNSSPRVLHSTLGVGGFWFAMNLWVLRRIEHGDIKLVSRLIIGVGWLVLAFGAYGSGGLYSSAMMGIFAMLITGTLLLDFRARIVLYVATITLVFALLIVELSGNLPYAPFKDLPFRVVVLTSTFTTLFLTVNYHLYAIRITEERIGDLKIGAERSKVHRELTQDLAHDLRTPLATLHTTAYLIRQRHQRGMPINDIVDRLEDQAIRLNTMIEDLFQLTMLEHAETQETFQILNLVSVMRASVADNRTYADSRNIKIEFDIAETVTYKVFGHQRQLRRVFDNIIENAVHYGNENGFVRITIEMQQKTYRIRIQDNGIGIAKEHQNHIFERFFRVDEARNMRAKQGSGLGLNAVQRIVTMHGGSIEIESQLGEGSTFTIILPTLEDKPITTQKTTATQVDAETHLSESR